ncbi:MAG: PQQ-binding-like beta-propeller repeat protein [Myxococcota bacterium]
MRQLVAIVASLALVAGCKAIPLNDDPTVPRREAHVSAPAIYEVSWWTPLVKIGLLEFKPLEPAAPAVDPDTERVIVSTRDGFVRCLSPVDGHVEWEKKTPNRFSAGAAISGGVAYVPGGDGTLYALRVLSGEEAWTYDAKEELVTTPTVAEGLVLVASQNDTLFAVDEASGAWKWQYRRDTPSGFTIRGASRPAVADGLVYAGFADGTVVALGLDDGVQRWERKVSVTGTQFHDVDTQPIVADGHVFVASYADGIVALDAKSGDLEWTSAKLGITSMVLKGRTLFCVGDGKLSAVETSQGRLLWSLDLSDKDKKGRGANAGVSLTVARGYVVVPTSTSLAFVDASAGRVRAMWNPGRGVTAAPTAFASSRNGARLYVLSNLGSVFALQLTGTGGG